MANGDNQPTFAQIPQPTVSPPLNSLSQQQSGQAQQPQGWRDWFNQRGNIIEENISRNMPNLSLGDMAKSFWQGPQPPQDWRTELGKQMNTASFLIGPRFFSPAQAEMFPLARMAEMQGMPAEQIARQFGGIRRLGASGQWGIEAADDPNVGFNLEAPQFEGMKPGESQEFRLGQYYQNDPFFQTYPQAQDMPVSLQRAATPEQYHAMPNATFFSREPGYPEGSMAIKRYDPSMAHYGGQVDRASANLLDFLMGEQHATGRVAHELGHYAQQKNKYPGGVGIPDQPDWRTPEGYEAYQNQAHEAQARGLTAGVGMSMEDLLRTHHERMTGGGRYPYSQQTVAPFTASPYDVPLTPENMNPNDFDALMWRAGRGRR
jgi:hypothetical protein